VHFEFIADRPVLDFLPTIAERGYTDVEHLRRPQDLAAWISQSGLLDNAPRVDDQDLERAKQLREAMFRLVEALMGNAKPAAVDRRIVNAAAAGALPQIRLEAAGLRRTGDIDAVLAVLARDCLDLFGSSDRELLRWCADPHCTRPYIDRSRGSRRRWCGMRGCGDRAKAAAYRQRQRSAEH